MSKGKRKKVDDEDEPVTYINDRNKVFNKKVSTCLPLVAKLVPPSVMWIL